MPKTELPVDKQTLQEVILLREEVAELKTLFEEIIEKLANLSPYQLTDRD